MKSPCGLASRLQSALCQAAPPKLVACSHHAKKKNAFDKYISSQSSDNTTDPLRYGENPARREDIGKATSPLGNCGWSGKLAGCLGRGRDAATYVRRHTPATHSRPHDGSTPSNAPATTVEVRRDEVGATRFSLQRGRRRELLPIADVPFRRAILTSNPGECRIDGSVTALISLLLLPLANRPGAQSALGHAPDRAKLVVAEHRPCGSPYSAIVWSIELGRAIRITLVSAVLCG